ncbi:thiamine diphosphokinase [Ectobacillus ponti]|uniref:Thiamine diphosphokinase n=1 Tax=Ectobacillus ponti TaxID=2961894 RepID=A0AA42BS42_9BACI|nr:thiamine diphosphokinase [Ectobacillus ponti]MCP8970179.1 thiamine diphosphokinase [Ectobacillus ponti]
MMIHLLAGGPQDHHPDLRRYNSTGVVWAAADRGVYHLLQLGIQLAAAFGDFDSVTDQELSWMQKRSELQLLPREKDETDLEIALGWALAQKPAGIRIFGATGGRLDHSLANIQLLVRGLEQGVPITLADRQNELSLRQAGRHTIQRDDAFPYVSFLPFTGVVEGLTLEGFKYPLTAAAIRPGSTLCVSNELAAEKGTFSFESGILMVVRSRD